MADYGILADFSTYLLERFRESLCPGLLAAREMVALNGPDLQESEAVLNLYLYDARESLEYSSSASVPLLGEAQGNPLAVTAYYIAYCSRHTQTPAGALTEHRILGKVFQTIQSMEPVEIFRIHEMADKRDQPVPVSFSMLKLTEKRDLWNAFSQPLRPAVYFQGGPLWIGTGKPGGAARVRQTEVKGL